MSAMLSILEQVSSLMKDGLLIQFIAATFVGVVVVVIKVIILVIPVFIIVIEVYLF